MVTALLGTTTAAGEWERIRRAIRYAVQVSRKHDGDLHCEYLFDLLPYLRDDASAVAFDEATRTLAEIVGGD